MFGACDFDASWCNFDCGSEIDEFDEIGFIWAFLFLVIGDDYVVEFDVSVDDVLVVEVGEGAEELSHDAGDDVFWEEFVAFEEINERAAAAELHYHVVVGLEVIDLVQFHYVGVVELTQEVEFGEEAWFFALWVAHTMF